MNIKRLLCMILLFLGISCNVETVLAAEEVVVVPEQQPSVEVAQTPEILFQVPTDPEEQLIWYTQMQVVLQGLPLEKYKKINVMGDSITEGVGASQESKTYPAVLGRLTGAVINNYGVSSSRITDADTDIPHPSPMVNRMYSMDKSADLIVVFGGTNDFWFGDCPIGKPSDRGQKTFYGALNTMMSYLKATYPNADIVFITPYQQSKGATETKPYDRSTYCNMGTGTLKDYRIAMLDRCQYYNIPVLDLYADFELNTVDNPEALRKYGQYLCDGCHLNDAGYNLLARKIYSFVMQDFTYYVPQYITVNNMVIETAALPALVQNGMFVMPNGQVILAKNNVVLVPEMGTKVLYNYLMEALYY